MAEYKFKGDITLEEAKKFLAKKKTEKCRPHIKIRMDLPIEGQTDMVFPYTNYMRVSWEDIRKVLDDIEPTAKVRKEKRNETLLISVTQLESCVFIG